MPRVGGEWSFEIVNARIELGRCMDVRPAIRLFVLDRKRSHLVPISSEMSMYEPGKHLLIDKRDPAFVATGLDPKKQSYVVENCAAPADEASIVSLRGWLKGTIADRYVLWSKRGDSMMVARGRNPRSTVRAPAKMIAEFLPWRDDPQLYHKLTTKTRSLEVGDAEYNVNTRRILVATTMWPNWYWWVFARAQQVWDTELTAMERRRWVDACRAHQKGTASLLEFWIGIRGRPLDITDANRQAQVVFAEACILVFEHDEPQHTHKSLANLAQQLGAQFFWR